MVASGSVAELRKQGFTEHMAELAPDMNLIEYATEFTREAGLADMADILTANSQIDAVFSMDDETSIGVLQAIRDAGRTDIKVITGGGGAQEWFNMMLADENQDICCALTKPMVPPPITTTSCIGFTPTLWIPCTTVETGSKKPASAAGIDVYKRQQ